MELTIVKKEKAENARITIEIDPDTQHTTMQLSYTCPGCGGHGCNVHRQNNYECEGGTVTKKLDPEHLDQIFDGGTLMKVKAAIQNLYLLVTGD